MYIYIQREIEREREGGWGGGIRPYIATRKLTNEAGRKRLTGNEAEKK